MPQAMTKLSKEALAAKRMRRKSLRVVAAPDDPIYSRGWQIGSAPVYREPTTTPEEDDSDQERDEK